MVGIKSALNNGSTTQWRKIRKRILERDLYTCQICGIEEATHVDHILPRSKGGLDYDENLRATCQTCNLTRKRKGAVFLFNTQTPKPPRDLFTPENTSISHVKGL